MRSEWASPLLKGGKGDSNKMKNKALKECNLVPTTPTTTNEKENGHLITNHTITRHVRPAHHVGTVQ
jgi:hypothetical protein